MNRRQVTFQSVRQGNNFDLTDGTSYTTVLTTGAEVMNLDFDKSLSQGLDLKSDYYELKVPNGPTTSTINTDHVVQIDGTRYNIFRINKGNLNARFITMTINERS